VWKLFIIYERIRKTYHLYDGNDLVANLFRRLEDHGLSGVWVHRLYVDEVQDFTMAEIYLLMRLTDPNFSFLAGDTAQTIARGVGFRFSELKTLFNEMNQEGSAKAQRMIRTPSPHSLPTSYRSHVGVLRLASAVVEVLYRYWRSQHMRPYAIGVVAR
jgi:superfamily I DNA/RNA helicase